VTSPRSFLSIKKNIPVAPILHLQRKRMHVQLYIVWTTLNTCQNAPL